MYNEEIAPATNMTDLILVLTTVGVDSPAEQLAHQLVEEHLAACVNILPPMLSLYRWKDGIERDSERQVVIKTTRSRLEALERRLRELHSYELPELIVFSAEGGSDAYLNWVREAVGSPRG